MIVAGRTPPRREIQGREHRGADGSKITVTSAIPAARITVSIMVVASDRLLTWVRHQHEGERMRSDATEEQRIGPAFDKTMDVAEMRA
jgi:hypothetical protein